MTPGIVFVANILLHLLFCLRLRKKEKEVESNAVAPNMQRAHNGKICWPSSSLIEELLQFWLDYLARWVIRRREHICRLLVAHFFNGVGLWLF